MPGSVLLRASFLACALLVLCAAAAQAATTLVPNRFDDPALGGDECKPLVTGKCSLRGAIVDAEAGDTIQLGAGTYILTIGQLVIDQNVSIVGAGPSATTIRQTAVGSRVIDAHTSLG